MATRSAAAPDTVQPLAAELYRRIALGEVGRVEVLYARYRQGATASVERRLLLPLDLASLQAKQPRQPPPHNLDPVSLHERLMTEHVFALLTDARQARQAEITTELLKLVSAAMALERDG